MSEVVPSSTTGPAEDDGEVLPAEDEEESETEMILDLVPSGSGRTVAGALGGPKCPSALSSSLSSGLNIVLSGDEGDGR